MRKPRHTLSKLEVLQYALDGACTHRGLYMGAMDEEEEELVDKDIKELQRRVKLTKIAEERKASQD